MPLDEKEPVHDSVDFEKLKPLSGLPKKGDIIAYRQLQFSSKGLPLPSPFQVRRVSEFNPESEKIMLAPVPGYLVTSEKKREDEDIDEKDGSLEISFSTLFEVRIVSPDNSDSITTVADGDKRASASCIEEGSGVRSSSIYDEPPVATDGSKKTSASDKGKSVVESTGGLSTSTIFDEIWQVLNENKSRSEKEASGSGRSK